MRHPRWIVAASLLAGCQPAAKPTTSPSLESDLPAPSRLSAWPTVTEKPVHVGPAMWVLCRPPDSDEARTRDAEAKPHGPHVGSIVVRVSPDALDSFRSGKTLPAGATVVKEKHNGDLDAMDAYALMIKREAGYDPPNGDWEYAYVSLTPERKVVRGRLPDCSGCHASAKERDYLFRSYGAPIPENHPVSGFIRFLERNGVDLEKAPGRPGQWRVKGRPPGQHYDVVVDFKTFPPDRTVEQMEAELLQINLAFQLNAPARLAMSFPGLQGLPGDDRQDFPDPCNMPVCQELNRLFELYQGP